MWNCKLCDVTFTFESVEQHLSKNHSRSADRNGPPTPEENDRCYKRETYYCTECTFSTAGGFEDIALHCIREGHDPRRANKGLDYEDYGRGLFVSLAAIVDMKSHIHKPSTAPLKEIAWSQEVDSTTSILDEDSLEIFFDDPKNGDQKLMEYFDNIAIGSSSADRKSEDKSDSLSVLSDFHSPNSSSILSTPVLSKKSAQPFHEEEKEVSAPENVTATDKCSDYAARGTKNDSDRVNQKISKNLSKHPIHNSTSAAAAAAERRHSTNPTTSEPSTLTTADSDPASQPALTTAKSVDEQKKNDSVGTTKLTGLNEQQRKSETMAVLRDRGKQIIEMSARKATIQSELDGEGRRVYCCSYCPKRFKSSSIARVHERVHTGARPFRCQLCGGTFTQRPSLTAHERIHTGEKSYCCEGCGKRFSQPYDLVKHFRVHSGERPYTCEMCNKAFIQKTVLQTHITSLHSHSSSIVNNRMPCRMPGCSLMELHYRRSSSSFMEVQKQPEQSIIFLDTE